jgi:hypothetical protein
VYHLTSMQTIKYLYNMYDLIGDIHGHAAALEQLLRKMDYAEVAGVWQHPQRKAIFVGDYIDRGPAIRQTLHIIRSMVEAGKAIALMGNHEYNALAYAWERPDGSHLRPHNTVHRHQHKATLEQFSDFPKEWDDFLEWFYTLPLFLELPELRAVHACWDEEQVNWLKRQGHYTMSPDLLVASHEKSSRAYVAINDILKGKEFNIPEENVWTDKDGHPRTGNRIRWWVDARAALYGDFLFNCPEGMRDKMIEEEIQYVVYPKEAPPVFFGHYWMEDPSPVVQSHNVVCLDYSIAKGGNLVAYRWNGEREVQERHFVSASYEE